MQKQISVGNASREHRWSHGLQCSAVLALCLGCVAEGLRGTGWLNPGAKFGLLCVYSEHCGVNSRALLTCTSSPAWAAHPTESGAQQAPNSLPAFQEQDVLLHPSPTLSSGNDFKAF